MSPPGDYHRLHLTTAHSMFGNREQTLPIWPELSKSPIITHLGWSDIAYEAFESNRHRFLPEPYGKNEARSNAPFDSLLALHIRRGDFIPHCPNLCKWGAEPNAFNRFSELPDQWEGPQGSEDERMAVYLRRCVPSIEQIVEKVEAILKTSEGQGLKNVYIMTNGDKQWLRDLKHALRELYPWERIATSRDLTLSVEEKHVSQAMDMMIGQRAQVFVGNGVSRVLFFHGHT